MVSLQRRALDKLQLIQNAAARISDQNQNIWAYHTSPQVLTLASSYI